MSAIGANKKAKAGTDALREVLAPAAPVEAMTTVYIVSRGGGGVVLTEAEVPTSALKVLRKRPPDALVFALATLTGWVANRFEGRSR